MTDKIRTWLVLLVLMTCSMNVFAQEVQVEQATPVIEQTQPVEQIPEIAPQEEKTKPVEPDTEPDDTMLANTWVYKLVLIYNLKTELAERIVKAVLANSYSDFPRASNILAIMSVESSFNPKASYKGSKGLMQMNVKAHRRSVKSTKDFYDIETSITLGAKLLHEYFKFFKEDESKTVQGYNAGPGTIQHGGRRYKYLKKYQRELKLLS